MTTVEEYFGTRAGTVWNALRDNGPMSIASLKRKTQLSTQEIYAALGWLGRENKIAITGAKPLQYKYSLREP